MRFDHWVHWVPDRDAAAAAYREAGFHVVIGGEHPGWGTHNALSHFGLPYLELIAFHDRAAMADPYPILTHGPRLLPGGGVGNFAIAVPEMAGAVAELRAQGFAVGEPQPGARQRPDGSVVRWQTASLLAGPAWRPFLIAWGDDGERLADLQARGVDAPHPLGALRLDHAELACGDPAGDAAWLARLVGAAPEQEMNGWRVPLAGCALLLTSGAAAGVAAGDLPRVTRLLFTGGAPQTLRLYGLELVIR